VLIFACVIVYQSLQQPEVLRMPVDFLIEEQGTGKIGKIVPSIDKYKTTRLTTDKKDDYLTRLEAHMNTDKPYLNTELTLADLAGVLNIPAYHLSQIINGEYEKNFYDFVNGYRLQEVVRALKDPANSNKYITQIMYDSGFNSKSVFNTAFKKALGQTPSEFRKRFRVSGVPAD
jgi:AraC-like DNA-binding protein